MPIDASSDPFDGTVGADPASADPDSRFDDLEAAGTGARAADLDLGGIDKGDRADDDTGPDKAELDVDDLDDAGRGAKVDPSITDDDGPIGKGLGSAVDELDLDDGPDKADLDVDDDPDLDDPDKADLGVGDLGKAEVDLDDPGKADLDLDVDSSKTDDDDLDTDDDVKDDLFDL